MDPTYTNWVFHGENPISSTPIENRSTVFTMYKDADIGYHDNIEPDVEIRDEDLTHIVEDVDIPLYDGCSKYTKVSAIVVLYKHKATHGLSDKGFDELLGILRDMLPQDNVLPDSLYSTKKLLKVFNLGYEKIHACINDCCLFRKELEHHEECPKYGTSRWKVNKSTKHIYKGVAAKVLRYFPIIPRFRRMFRSPEMANDLTWHSTHRSQDGKMRHPVDSEARKTIDDTWLGLAADGFNPYKNLSSTYSCWPPENDIDVYLQPLIEDLNKLWNAGVEVHDSSTNSNKQKREKKSHDCHVMMQQLLSVAICGLLPKGPRIAIFRLCSFFNDICQRVLDKSKLDSLEDEKSTQDSGVSIEAETICTITGRDGSQVTKKMMSTEGPSDTPSSSSKRKGRGPNQINFNKIAKAKEVGVTFNELGQPLGDSSIALSTCIGTITTQMIPITYSSWPEVPDVVKNSVWETMKARFGLHDIGKSNVFNSMNTCWRQYKSRLTKRIRELSFGPEAGRMIQLLKPTNITDEDWSQFVSNHLSSEFDIISSKYSDLAKKNKAPHTTSRKGLARLREDLRAKKSVESGDLEDREVDRVETWIAGHKHKDGTPVTEDAGEIIKQLEEISGNQATSISDDAVSQVLGKEHRGRVRRLGGGVTPTRVNASVVGKQITTQLREEMKKQNKRHEDEMKRQQDEMNALKQQLKDLQSFVFNMQQQYSSASNLSGGNKCLNIAVTSAKSFSKASTSHMDGSSEKEKKCKLLHWMGNGEVVAEAEVDCRDPQAVVHGMILGPDCWRVSVKKILVSKVPLYRATTEFMTLEDTLNLFITWPAKYVL
ncbi:hypothetical protein ACOSQ4_028863 [Xanthoceras sorbifolium]